MREFLTYVSEIIGDIRLSFEAAGPSAGFSGLFLAGLISLWYSSYEAESERSDERSLKNRQTYEYIFLFAVVLSALLVSPAGMMLKDYMPVYLWLMPYTPLVLCVAASAFMNVNNRKSQLILFAAFSALLMLAGASGFDGAAFSRALGNDSYGIMEYLGESFG